MIVRCRDKCQGSGATLAESKNQREEIREVNIPRNRGTQKELERQGFNKKGVMSTCRGLNRESTGTTVSMNRETSRKYRVGTR